MPTCRIHTPTELPDERLLAALRSLPSSVVSDQLEAGGFVPGLRPLGDLHAGEPLAGPALTVRTSPGDNLVVHHAIDLAREGEVLVIDADSVVDSAVMGEIVYRYAVSRGVAGVVIDGAVRDSSEIARAAVPVFVRGVSPVRPGKDGSGEIRGTVTLSGVAVHDGDLVVGDADGLVVVPRGQAEVVLDAAQKALAQEPERLAAAAEGRLDRSWIGERLQIELVDG